MPEEAAEQGTIRYIRCLSCGMPNPDTSERCARCNKPLQGSAKEARSAAPPTPTEATGQIICSKCRKALPAGSKFCGFCGAPLAAAPAEPKARPGPQPAPATPPTPSRRPGPSATEPGSKPVVAPAARPPVGASRPATLPGSPAPATSPPSPDQTQVLTGLRRPKTEARIVEIKSDGTPGTSVAVVKETSIGRGPCNLSYPNDALLSSRHARVYKREAKVYLQDFGTPSGTFIKQRKDTALRAGDVFVLGGQIFRFTLQKLGENPVDSGAGALTHASALQSGPVAAKLELIQLSGEVIKEFSLVKPETTIGRSKGDWLFQDDQYMSGAHARIVAQPGQFVLQDLKSRNGVYHQIREEVELQDGDEFFMGEQRFRIEIKAL